MIGNRSVPTDVVLPHLIYQDLHAAVAWLTSTFGFTEHYRYGDPVAGVQMSLGKAWIMLSGPKPGAASPEKTGYRTQSLTIFVEDVDAHFGHSKAAGANIVEDLNETCYGERQYGVIDLEGHHWLFSRHARDVAPDAWGATVAKPVERNNVQVPVPMFMVADMTRSLAYYVEGLGFQRLNQWTVDSKIRWCWLARGDAAVMLQERRAGSQPVGKACEGVSIWFQCGDSLALYYEFQSRGIAASEPQVGNGLWDTRLIDPDGYYLHFESPTDVPEETRLSEVKA